MDDFINWLLGFPKCKVKGRCNADTEMHYNFYTKKFFEKSHRYRCSKCGEETTKYIQF